MGWAAPWLRFQAIDRPALTPTGNGSHRSADGLCRLLTRQSPLLGPAIEGDGGPAGGTLHATGRDLGIWPIATDAMAPGLFGLIGLFNQLHVTLLTATGGRRYRRAHHVGG